MPRLITPAQTHRASALAVLAATALITACVPANTGGGTDNTGSTGGNPPSSNPASTAILGQGELGQLTLGKAE